MRVALFGDKFLIRYVILDGWSKVESIAARASEVGEDDPLRELLWLADDVSSEVSPNYTHHLGGGGSL